jgi:predicted lipoprotein DUF2279
MRFVALAALMVAPSGQAASAQRMPALSTSYTALSPEQGSNDTRLWLVGGLHVVVGVLVYMETQQTWGHSRGRFHVKDDWTGDGLSQNDEASHLFFGYTLTKTFAGQWHWAGMSPRKARTVGAVETAGVLTMVEVLDAFNPAQGLGVQDLVFDYAGIGLGVLSLSRPDGWSIRMSSKAPAREGPFAETVRQSDNYIFWVTYRPPWPGGSNQPVSLGLGHGVRRGPDGVSPVREVHLGIGTTVPDILRPFSPHAARLLGILDFYYLNLDLTATVK